MEFYDQNGLGFDDQDVGDELNSWLDPKMEDPMPLDDTVSLASGHGQANSMHQMNMLDGLNDLDNFDHFNGFDGVDNNASFDPSDFVKMDQPVGPPQQPLMASNQQSFQNNEPINPMGGGMMPPQGRKTPVMGPQGFNGGMNMDRMGGMNMGSNNMPMAEQHMQRPSQMNFPPAGSDSGSPGMPQGGPRGPPQGPPQTQGPTQGHSPQGPQGPGPQVHQVPQMPQGQAPPMRRPPSSAGLPTQIHMNMPPQRQPPNSARLPQRPVSVGPSNDQNMPTPTMPERGMQMPMQMRNQAQMPPNFPNQDMNFTSAPRPAQQQFPQLTRVPSGPAGVNGPNGPIQASGPPLMAQAPPQGPIPGRDPAMREAINKTPGPPGAMSNHPMNQMPPPTNRPPSSMQSAPPRAPVNQEFPVHPNQGAPPMNGVPPSGPPPNAKRNAPIQQHPNAQPLRNTDIIDITLCVVSFYTQLLKFKTQNVDLLDVRRHIENFPFEDKIKMVQKFEYSRQGYFAETSKMPVTRFLPQVFSKTVADVYSQIQRANPNKDIFAGGTQIPLLRLFQEVQLAGGFLNTTLWQRWPAVVKNLGVIAPIDVDAVLEVVAGYANTLLIFEVYTEQNESVRRALVQHLGPPPSVPLTQPPPPKGRMPGPGRPPTGSRASTPGPGPASQMQSPAMAYRNSPQVQGQPQLPPGMPGNMAPATAAAVAAQRPIAQASIPPQRITRKPSNLQRSNGPPMPEMSPDFNGRPVSRGVQPVLMPQVANQEAQLMRNSPDMTMPPQQSYMSPGQSPMPRSSSMQPQQVMSPPPGSTPINYPGTPIMPGPNGTPLMPYRDSATLAKRPLDDSSDESKSKRIYGGNDNAFHGLIENGNYLVQRRHTSKYGGRNITQLNKLINEVESWRLEFPVPLDLGTIDLHAVTLSLASGFPGEVRQALDKLLVLSSNPRVHQSLQHCPGLLANICKVIKSLLVEIRDYCEATLHGKTPKPLAFNTMHSEEAKEIPNDIDLLGMNSKSFQRTNELKKRYLKSLSSKGSLKGKDIEISVNSETGTEFQNDEEPTPVEIEPLLTTPLLKKEVKEANKSSSGSNDTKPPAKDTPFGYMSYGTRYKEVERFLNEGLRVSDEKADFILQAKCSRLSTGSCALRNLSFNVSNRPVLANKPQCVDLLWSSLEVFGETPNMLDTVFRRMDISKDILTILGNISLYLKISTHKQALLVILFLLSYAPVDSPYTEDGKIRLQDYDIDVHRYLPNAVDAFIKMAPREEPNRRIIEEVLLGTTDDPEYKLLIDRWLKFQNRTELYPAELLTRMFSMVVAMLPLTHSRPPSRDIETRQPYLLQATMTAELLVNMIPDNDLGYTLAHAWLYNSEMFGARFVRTLNFMGMVVVTQKDGVAQRPFAKIIQRGFNIIQKLIHRAKLAPGFTGTGIVPTIEHLLGSLMAVKMDKVVIKHLAALYDDFVPFRDAKDKSLLRKRE